MCKYAQQFGIYLQSIVDCNSGWADRGSRASWPRFLPSSTRYDTKQEGLHTMKVGVSNNRRRLPVVPLLALGALAIPLGGGTCGDNTIDDLVNDITDDVVAGVIEEAEGNAGSNAADFGDQGADEPGYGPFLETGGMVVVEAETYTKATPNRYQAYGLWINLDNRRWYMQDGASNGPTPDPDGFHGGAAGNNYVECLPDTRVTHDDPIADGSLFGEVEGGARLDYDIDFETAGTYYVWVRAYSTGTEDNGMHVGIDDVIPDTGWKIQHCGQGKWNWTNAQRDSGGSSCGVNGTVKVVVDSPGVHTVSFHQREDGFEFDRFILTTDANYTPTGEGPAASPEG